LLGSRTLSAMTDILIKTPKDKSRILGSKRLRQAREILFHGVTGEECDKMLGSRRLGMAKQILTKGVNELDDTPQKRQKQEVAVTPRVVVEDKPQVDVDVEAKAEAKVAAPVVEGKVSVVAERLATAAAPEQPLQYAGIIATEEQKKQIADIRKQILAISAPEKETMSPWIDEMLDVDIFRYVSQFKAKYVYHTRAQTYAMG
jgi:hypothetical protein